MDRLESTDADRGVMDMTVTLNPNTIIAFCTCITVVVAALKALWEVKKVLNKPLDDIRKKLDDHDKFLANDKEHLEKIDYILEDIAKAMNLQVKSLKTVLSHLSDGNHTGEIKKREEELDDWLMEGKRYDGSRSNQ